MGWCGIYFRHSEDVALVDVEIFENLLEAQIFAKTRPVCGVDSDQAGSAFN